MMDSKIEELRNLCLEKLNNKDQLTEIQSDISFKDKFEELAETEREQFIKLCDNRLENSKDFVNVTVILFGFFITVVSIWSPKTIDITLLPFLIVIAIVAIYLYISYKRHISYLKGWAAFKEMTLIKYKKV